jgi:type III pantothenate kinase
MLLAVDVGNTETVIGLFDPPPNGELVDHWRVSTNVDRTADELALLIQEFLAFHGFSFDTDVRGVVVSSGVPRLTAALREMTERYFGFPALVLEAGVKTGLPVLYDNPRDVAPDRIANAVGALETHRPPLVIIDFGTATIFDAISAKGEYVGGVLVPGIELGLDALVGRAAMLRPVELLEPRSVIGRNTAEAIQSGVVHGMDATGRLADRMARFCGRIDVVDPLLTLRGLRHVYDRN